MGMSAQDFAVRLRRLMELRGVGATELEQRCDFGGRDRINRWLKGAVGEPNLDAFGRLCLALDCIPSDLLGPKHPLVQAWDRRRIMAERPFADWLNAQMAAASITSSYLASSLGCSKVAVNVWRSGRGMPNQLSRERIAAFFAVDVAEVPNLQAPKPAKPAVPQLSGIVFR